MKNNDLLAVLELKLGESIQEQTEIFIAKEKLALREELVEEIVKNTLALVNTLKKEVKNNLLFAKLELPPKAEKSEAEPQKEKDNEEFVAEEIAIQTDKEEIEEFLMNRPEPIEFQPLMIEPIETEKEGKPKKQKEPQPLTGREKVMHWFNNQPKNVSIHDDFYFHSLYELKQVMLEFYQKELIKKGYLARTEKREFKVLKNVPLEILAQ